MQLEASIKLEMQWLKVRFIDVVHQSLSASDVLPLLLKTLKEDFLVITVYFRHFEQIISKKWHTDELKNAKSVFGKDSPHIIQSDKHVIFPFCTISVCTYKSTTILETKRREPEEEGAKHFKWSWELTFHIVGFINPLYCLESRVCMFALLQSTVGYDLFAVSDIWSLLTSRCCCCCKTWHQQLPNILLNKKKHDSRLITEQ